MRKKKIILSLPLVWSVRNFILSGIHEKLSDKFEVYYAIPEGTNSYFKNLGIAEERLTVLEMLPKRPAHLWVRSLLKRAFAIKNPLPENRIFELKHTPAVSGNLRSRINSMFFLFLARLFSFGPAFQLLISLEYFLAKRVIPGEYRRKIATLKPDLGLSTANVSTWEDQLFLTLKSLKVPVVAHILSFDNITSRGWLSGMTRFDHYMVWNQRMKNELTRIYEIDHDQISITGTPQFDFHLNAPQEIPDENIGKRLQKKFVLYCANHHHLTPREPELLEAILDMFNQDIAFREYSLILRLHPMDRYERWNEVLVRFPNVILNLPWAHPDERVTFWGEPTRDDMLTFSFLLKNSAAVLHIASTIAIDAAVVDTPIICIGFHPDRGSEDDKKYHDYHFTNHYAPIMELGASPIANDVVDLKLLLNEAIKNKEKLTSKRKNLKEKICGNHNGNVGEIIISNLYLIDRSL